MNGLVITINGNFDFVKYLVEVKGAEITNEIVNASFYARKNGTKYSGPIEPVRTYLIAGGNPDTIEYLSRKIEQARKMKYNMRAKSINELKNFERGIDPKRAMGTGMGSEIDMATGMKIFVTWTYNLNPNFVRDVWGDDNMGDHMLAKWKGIMSRSKEDFMDPNSIIKFCHELSDGHRMKLFQYIVEHYKDQYGK